MLCRWSHRAAGLKAGHGHDPSHQTQQRGQALSGSRREGERKEQRGERNCSPGQRERPGKVFPREGGSVFGMCVCHVIGEGYPKGEIKRGVHHTFNP